MKTSMENQPSFQANENLEKIYNDSVDKPTSIQRKYVGELKKKYENDSSDDNANLYATILFNLSLRVTSTEMVAISHELKILFQENPTQSTAEALGRIKFNQSYFSTCTVGELKQYATEIEQLYDKYKTDRLAEPLAKIWYSIAISKARDRLDYATKIVKMCATMNDPQTNTAYARVIFNQKFSNIEKRDKLIEEFLSKPQALDSFGEYIKSPYYPEYNRLADSLKLESSYPVEILGKRMNKFFNENKFRNQPNYVDLKVEILALLYYAFEIKNLLIVPETKDFIGHYTKIENLKYLVLPNNTSAKLRMWNANYMNDPSEGKALISFLQGTEVNETRFSIDKSSNIYLSCFTTAIDELPMWSMYGNEGHGCCLVFKRDFFDYTHEDLTDSFWLGCDKNVENNFLYRVCYLSYTPKKFTITFNQFQQDPSDLGNRITIALSNFKKHFDKIASLKQRNDNLVDKIVEEILDQIRYLFKDSSYAHENELRLIKYSVTPLVDDKSWIVPQLYVEIEKSLEYKQVILGPKVLQENRIMPYLFFSGKVKEVKKSKTQYR
ncbi:MAG: DUF2971 domain-containing protein [Oscillospiraceae bacterium]|nr:DUF2971 domain-containing protein [Oscillospiraceae bacterium]